MRISWAVTASLRRESIAWKSSKLSRLVLVERITLGVAAEADHLAEMLERDEVLAPEVVERLHEHGLLDLAHDLGGETHGALGGRLVRGAGDALLHLVVGNALFLRPVGDRHIEVEDAVDGVVQGRRHPTAPDRPFPGCGGRSRSSITSWRMPATVSVTVSWPIRSMR